MGITDLFVVRETNNHPTISLTMEFFKITCFLMALVAFTSAVPIQMQGEEPVNFVEEATTTQLPCQMPVCKQTCKNVDYYQTETFGDVTFRLGPYQKEVCTPPPASCEAEKAACQKALIAAMKHAGAMTKKLAAAKASVAGAAAHVDKTSADLALRKDEVDAAKKYRDIAQSAFDAAAKEAAQAELDRKAQLKVNKDMIKTKDLKIQKTVKAMDAARANYTAMKKAHLAALAAFDGAQSVAEQAKEVYDAALKEHCDVESQHADAVKAIGHGHLSQRNCQRTCQGHEFNSWTNMNGWYRNRNAGEGDCAYLCNGDARYSSKCSCYTWSTADGGSCKLYGA